MNTLFPKVERRSFTSRISRYSRYPIIDNWRIPYIAPSSVADSLTTEDGIDLTTEDGVTIILDTSSLPAGAMTSETGEGITTEGGDQIITE